VADDIQEQLEASLRREAALAGVLRAVAASSDLPTVLFEIARVSAELSGAVGAAVFVGEGDVIAVYGQDPDGASTRIERPFGDDSALTSVLRKRVTLSFDDQSNIDDPAFAQSADIAKEREIKSSVFVPLPASGPPVGVIAFKRIVDPFTAEQIELLETFATQAGNAVTNARLVADIEERNAELADALALQTATSEILELISEHPGELRIVLDGVLTWALELIGADQGAVMLRHGDRVRMEAAVGGATVGLGTESNFADGVGVVIFDEPTFFEDRTAEAVDKRLAEFFRIANVRSSANVPLTIDGQWIGQINMSRTEVRPFDDAIRNAGLFNDLEEALELQTATSEVLGLISEHPGDLTTVLEGILAKAAELCGGEAGSITMTGDGGTRYMASHGPAMEP